MYFCLNSTRWCKRRFKKEREKGEKNAPAKGCIFLLDGRRRGSSKGARDALRGRHERSLPIGVDRISIGLMRCIVRV